MVVLAWMVVGVIKSGKIGIPDWTPYVESRAQYAQSTQKRFHRWVYNDRIDVNELYGPLIQEGLAEWGDHKLYLTLDTSRLLAGFLTITA